eukprot:TRINITY_DN17117_c0_g1_i2.p1 TRINITY_DN17117_c0_g1~~TRINITY_DN17117_c0_g1_i2.p1  ORF type:complete len:684 (+),score=103.17 TRINITY_DN17117_c0_g1_i2:23-2074(+)
MATSEKKMTPQEAEEAAFLQAQERLRDPSLDKFERIYLMGFVMQCKRNKAVGKERGKKEQEEKAAFTAKPEITPLARHKQAHEDFAGYASAWQEKVKTKREKKIATLEKEYAQQNRPPAPLDSSLRLLDQRNYAGPMYGWESHSEKFIKERNDRLRRAGLSEETTFAPEITQAGKNARKGGPDLVERLYVKDIQDRARRLAKKEELRKKESQSQFKLLPRTEKPTRTPEDLVKWFQEKEVSRERALKKKIKEVENNAGCTLSPKLSEHSTRIVETIARRPLYSNEQLSPSQRQQPEQPEQRHTAKKVNSEQFQKFLESIDEAKKKRERKMSKVAERLEKEKADLCTFSPKIGKPPANWRAFSVEDTPTAADVPRAREASEFLNELKGTVPQTAQREKTRHRSSRRSATPEWTVGAISDRSHSVRQSGRSMSPPQYRMPYYPRSRTGHCCTSPGKILAHGPSERESPFPESPIYPDEYEQDEARYSSPEYDDDDDDIDDVDYSAALRCFAESSASHERFLFEMRQHSLGDSIATVDREPDDRSPSPSPENSDQEDETHNPAPPFRETQPLRAALRSRTAPTLHELAMDDEHFRGPSRGRNVQIADERISKSSVKAIPSPVTVQDDWSPSCLNEQPVLVGKQENTEKSAVDIMAEWEAAEREAEALESTLQHRVHSLGSVLTETG